MLFLQLSVIRLGSFQGWRIHRNACMSNWIRFCRVVRYQYQTNPHKKCAGTGEAVRGD